MSMPHPPLSRAAPLPAAPAARGVVVHPHTAAAAAAAAPPGSASWPALPAHAPALPAPVPAPVADVLLPPARGGGAGGSAGSAGVFGRFPLPQPQPVAAAASAPPAPPAAAVAIPSPNLLPLPLPSPLPPPPPPPQPPASATTPGPSQCSTGAAAVRPEAAAAATAVATGASFAPLSSSSGAAAAALGSQTQERRRSRHIVDDLLVVIDTLLALLPLDSLFTLRHTCSRMRNVASAKMGLHTVGLILDHLGASVGGGPVFLSGAGSPCDAEHPVARFVATGGGHLRWAQQTSAAAAEPPPSQLFIPFNGFSMTAFWGLVPYITQGMFNGDMWDMMTTPEEVRKYVHGTWAAFHKHEVAELPRHEALATLKVWGLLEALLASLTRSYRFHNVYVELRSLDPGSRRSIQMRPLLYEKA